MTEPTPAARRDDAGGAGEEPADAALLEYIANVHAHLSPGPVGQKRAARLRALAAELPALRARLAAVEGALQDAADVFDFYADLHGHKGTEEGRQKAEANRGHAAVCRAALPQNCAPKPSNAAVLEECERALADLPEWRKAAMVAWLRRYGEMEYRNGVRATVARPDASREVAALDAARGGGGGGDA